MEHILDKKILIIIPARGGSKGIPRKNVRFINGQPLISYSINTSKLTNYNVDTWVSTDDEEISSISKNYGANVLLRPRDLAEDNITLDPVIFHAVTQIEKTNKKNYDTVITLQPTSPLLSVITLNKAIDSFYKNNFDTLISVVNKPHLSWIEENGIYKKNYKDRLNRQKLPKNLIETGAFLITKREFISFSNRIGKNLSVFEMKEEESIDIDSKEDWIAAEKIMSRLNIVIRVEGYSEIGLGHIYRGLLLNTYLIDHNIKLITSSRSQLGINKLKNSNFPFEIINSEQELFQIGKSFNADILINDILNTNKEYMYECKRVFKRVVNFEDLGEGSILADLVINDLYEKSNNLPNHYWGSDYFLIRDEFKIIKPYIFNYNLSKILVIFGGSDPSNLTRKIFDVVISLNRNDLQFTFILGLGYSFYDELNLLSINHKNIKIIKDVNNISQYMLDADLAISSQGRTMLELASVGVPTILLAQNKRELTHEFGYMQNGFINLGFGKDVDDFTIKQTLLWLISTPLIRLQMHKEMKKKNLTNGFERIKPLILGNFLKGDL